MPLYEYRCRKCGTVVEKIQRFSDPPLTKCEQCGGKLEKLLSPPAIQFKGSGWYVTDYARKPTASKPDGGSNHDGAPGESKKEKTAATKSSESSKSAPAAKK